MNTLHNQRGFTLIELLVVVLIIGILAAVALPQYTKAVAKSRFAEAMINLKTIANAHEVCFMEQGEPCSMDDLAVSVGEHNTTGIGYEYRTGNFGYIPQTRSLGGGEPNTLWAVAQYDKEDVCLCYLQTGEIVVNQNDGGCVEKEPSFDYGKLLKLREVGYDVCGCC